MMLYHRSVATSATTTTACGTSNYHSNSNNNKNSNSRVLQLPIHHHTTATATPGRIIKRRRKKSKQLKISKSNNNGRVIVLLLICFVSINVVIYLIRILITKLFLHNQGSLSAPPTHWDETLLEHWNTYEYAYQYAHSSTTTTSSNDNRELSSPDTTYSDTTKNDALHNSKLNKEWLQPTYGTNIQTCPITVLFMDPRLGDAKYGYGQAAWFALESIAYSMPTACVLLLTTDCLLPSIDSIRENIYNKSLPLFRKNMIEHGNVRLNILDYKKYKMKSCTDYSNLSSALMNINFWYDEFINNIDNDLILTIQDDSVICTNNALQYINTYYNNYSYIGAPWPPIANELIPYPSEGMCTGMLIRWKSWLLPQQQYKKKPNKYTKPDQLLLEEFVQPICQHDGYGPIGNGGLSLRNRTYMIQAIQTCPHVKYSGIIDNNNHNFACKVYDDINEDFYFSVILRGINASIPSAYVASMFAVESLWSEDIIELYGVNPNEEDLIKQLSNKRPHIIFDNKKYTIPIGIHKAFWYHPNELLRSKELQNYCPYFKYVFVPSMSRWREIEKNPKTWSGIGS